MRVNRRRLLTLLASALAFGSGCLEHPDAEPTVEVAIEKQLSIQDGAFTPAWIEVPKGYPSRLIFENLDERAYLLSSPELDVDLRVPPGGTVRERVNVPTGTGHYEIHCTDSKGILEVRALPAHIVGGCGCGMSLTDEQDEQ